jgi:hypothetical protein
MLDACAASAARSGWRRRRWLVGAAASMAGLCTGAQGRVQGTAGEAALPTFDAHLHYSHDAWERVPPREAVALMRQAGLKRAMVSSSNDDGTQKLHAEAPDLVLPVLRPYRNRSEVGTWIRDDSVVAHLEARLARYRYVAIGEYHVSGSDADLPVMRRVVQLARERRLALHSHSDADAVERQFKQDPAARILWAHAGFDAPANVRTMLRRYPNLWCDLAFRSDHAMVDGQRGKVHPIAGSRALRRLPTAAGCSSSAACRRTGCCLARACRRRPSRTAARWLRAAATERATRRRCSTWPLGAGSAGPAPTTRCGRPASRRCSTRGRWPQAPAAWRRGCAPTQREARSSAPPAAASPRQTMTNSQSIWPRRWQPSRPRCARRERRSTTSAMQCCAATAPPPPATRWRRSAA